MHTRLATALTVAVLALTAAPALADDEPTPSPVAAQNVVTAVESSLTQARTASPASKRSTCLAEHADAITQARLTTGEWPAYKASTIATECKVLRVVAVRDYSASQPEDIAKRLVGSKTIADTSKNAFTSQHAASSFSLEPDRQTATLLLVAEPRHQSAFAPAATRSINRAFVAARTAKPKLTHSTCLSKAAHAWSKERVATVGATPGRREATAKACRMRVLGLSLFETKGSTKQIVAKVRTSTVFRGYTDRRTPVSYAAAVYVDKVSGLKQVIFFAGQPK